MLWESFLGNDGPADDDALGSGKERALRMSAAEAAMKAGGKKGNVTCLLMIELL